MRITEENYVTEAENVIKKLLGKNGAGTMVTTSQIRNILAMTSDIYNQVINAKPSETLSDEICSRIEYLKVRIVYECGRDGKEGKVRSFVETADLLGNLKQIGKSRKNFILFCRYMEALVAYHRYHGGSDY